ncbi:RNA polymerase sigma factor [Pseudoalteromonas sp. T1lg76]|uniref:RNA polymerase sigma factor n=1 Tax=Pseudoalteromonas sp. T1lg76 TaxID=2077103 RepID=UPI000CF6ECE9|nr:sigma-70 family RNA polymerase sigma factor [Pseudoalteromonas sp. T1lg76]
MIFNSEQRLIIKAQSGSNKAWLTLVKRHEKRLYNQCLRLLQHPDDALDVMQETFISAYQGLGQFNGQSQLHTWLFRIAYNKSAEHFRRHRQHQSLDEVAEPSSNVLHMERPLMQAQQNQRLLAELARLPFEQRVVVEMKFFQHCTFEEIAQQLEVSANTVKTRLYAALGRLKPQLEVHDGQTK